MPRHKARAVAVPAQLRERVLGEIHRGMQMRLTGRTILITGGTSGIGLELATELVKRGDTVIVTGRDQGRLEAARQALPGVHVFRSESAIQRQ